MLNRLGRINPANLAQLTQHLESNKDRLTADVSSYAPNRQRYWLQHEWDLGKRTFTPAIRDERIWRYCQYWMPDADLGLVVHGVVVAHLVNAYAGLRRKLSPHEEEILQRGWQAPVGPYAIMDSRADAMEGDLLMQQGDRERATARYQSAWERLAPLLAQWDRSRAVMSGEHLRSLRQRLLPHVTQP